MTSTPPTLPNAGPYADHQLKPKGPLKRLAGWLVVIIAIASTAVWAGAVIWGWAADPKPVNWLDNREFPEAAEPICAAHIEELNEYPKAHKAKNPAERAVTIRQTTAILVDMIDELRAIVPDDADAKWINMWLDDYGMHIEDRLAFADKLEGPNPEQQEFYESIKADKQISVSLNEFAKQNQMHSCVTPGDV